jgi:D-glycero-alpha-D-manno-heptose-7-phosphate kinase
MIVVQTPLRVSFFGGGTDFPSFFMEEGGCVLSSAINKFIFVTVKRRFDQKLRVGYTKTEMVDDIDEIQHELFREALRKTGIFEATELTSMGDIPSAGSGLGSSSTVTVGALHALYTYLGHTVPAERLAQEACQIELETLQKPIGIQDQYIAAFGGLRFMEFHPDGTIAVNRINLDDELRQRLDERLLLFFTGITRNSETILTEQNSNIKDRTKVLREMKSLAFEARDALLHGELDAIGHQMNQSWQLKKQLASRISNPEIDELYAGAIKAGATGGKITGAGGGGFLLLYCPKSYQQAVRYRLQSLQELPFQLERDGSKVIFNYRRSYAGAPAMEREETSQIKVQLNWEQLGIRTKEPILPVLPAVLSSAAPADQYLEQMQDLLGQLPVDGVQRVIQILHEARKSHRQVILMGNGGSASTASHFACDLSKNTRVAGWPDFRATSLGDNLAVLTAYANDEGFRNIFVEPLASILLPDDVVIGISTSGKSDNVLRAIDFARKAQATTIGFTGFDSGSLGDMVDVHIHVPSNCIEQVEDVHLMLEHMITKTLREMAEAPMDLDTKLAGLKHAEQIADSSADQTGGEEGWTGSFERVDPVAVLYRVNRVLSAKMDIDDTLQEVLKVALEDLGAISGSVLILNEDGSLSKGSIAYNGQLSNRSPEEFGEVLKEGLAGWVVKNRKPALVSDTHLDDRWIRRTWDQEQAASRSVISVPLMSQDKPRGVLTLAHSKQNGFASTDMVVLNAIALCVAMNGFSVSQDKQ